MPRHASILAAAVFASTLAGIVFVLCFWIAESISFFPGAIRFDLSGWAGFFVMLPAVVVIGFVLAIVPTIIGAAMMTAVSMRSESMRSPVAWVAAGAIMAVPVSGLLGMGEDGASLAAFAATGAICAGLCRMVVRLD